MTAGSNSTLHFQLKKHGYTITHGAKAIGVTKKMFYEYIRRPLLMRGEHYAILSSLFGISALELFYLLLHDKPQILPKRDKWFLEGVRQRGDEIIQEMEQSKAKAL